MKKCILLFTMLCFTSMFSQNINEEKDILYSEYHPSISYASKNENFVSLMEYIQAFERLKNVKLKEVYVYQLTDNSYSYFFTLSELDNIQRLDFVSGRLEAMDKQQIRLAISMLIDPPKKLATYINAIADETYPKVTTLELFKEGLNN